jgi:bifunctional non-homologous end joining protein LigD
VEDGPSPGAVIRSKARKATLASMLDKAGLGLRFNEHMEGDGPTVFAHTCKMGLEGIVSKRKDSFYRSGRLPDWLKMKNPGSSDQAAG